MSLRKIVAGGGASFFSLVLAIISILSLTFAAPSTVHAAEPTACPDGCNAYIWNGDSVIQLKTQTGETPKFTSLDRYYGPATNATVHPVLQDIDGKTWTFTGEYLQPISLTGLTLMNHEVAVNYPGHTARGDATGRPAPVGDVDGIPSANIQWVDDHYLSVDAKGCLWAHSEANTNTGSTVAQDSDDIEFMDIDSGVVTYPSGALTNVFLLGKPRAQTPQTVINQMPTTGAPEGLTSVGLTAMMLGLFGLALITVRRRR